MRRIYKRLKSKRGSGYVFSCVIIIVMAMILSFLWLYVSCINVVRGNKTYVSQKLDAYLTKYMVEHADLMTYGNEIYGHIDSSGLKQGALKVIGAENGNEVKTSSESVMKDFNADYLSGAHFGVKVTYELLIPIRFAGKDVGKLKVPIRIKSRVVYKN